jgi:hypothetical protein
MGRVGTLQSIVLKISHFRHLPEVLLDHYGRPTESVSLRPANESCERCHWPPAFHGDTVREIIHYQPNEENTQERTYLILKTGGGEREEGLGVGIHWHIANEVEFIATDERDQKIPWVRTTLPDGRTLEYTDVANPLTEEQLADAEIKVMDCVDCHNRVGHPFPPPKPAIDEAITEGRISRDLPYIKRELADLLTDDYPDQQAALAAAEAAQQEYAATYPEADDEEVQQAFETTDELIERLIFETPGVTWESFPDNSQHREFAGCFRCHDGKHFTSGGESIRLHCNICHSIPVTVGENERVPQMPVATVEEPPSHRAPNFMADHRFQADESCVTCHGIVDFGTDDSSFCSNSACHGQAWPEVQLDAGFEHPIELVGQHADVWCHDCHEGVKKPEYKCSNCHEPPSEPHFGEVCENWHTPEGFEQVDMEGFEHPVALVGAHATADCLACHSAGFDLEFKCANCHQPPTEPHFGDACENCHTPEGFESADLSDFEHPIALVGNHATADCMACHSAGFDLEYRCANCHQPPTEPHFGETCENCHTPEGFESADLSGFEHPIALVGNHATADCMACHSAGFDLEYECANCHHPPEEPHFGETCADCHTPEGFESPDLSGFEHPVPLEGQHAAADCMACHVAGFDLVFECDVCHQPPPDHFEAPCDSCHAPVGWAESVAEITAEAPQIPHPEEAFEKCLTCHDPEEGTIPAPQDHTVFLEAQCVLCHVEAQ